MKKKDCLTMMTDSVNPLKSTSIEIDQLKSFNEDLLTLQKVTDDKYLEDFEDLRDKTNLLRSEYSILYSKILTENPKMKWVKNIK